MELEDLVILLIKAFILFMIFAILVFVTDIDSKTSNVQNNCIIAKNETYCKVGGDK